jgi:hypothetical protein
MMYIRVNIHFKHICESVLPYCGLGHFKHEEDMDTVNHITQWNE